MKKFMKAKAITIVSSLLVASALIAVGTQPWWSAKTQEVYVNKSERVEQTYMVYSDKGVFRNEDSWHYFKFDSSDLYNKLEQGKTYTCKSYGFRVGFLSVYPNLVSCK